jgi:hypothetical protein
MRIKEIFKSIKPYFLAIIIFTVISFAYFYPVLEGKVLKANDSTVSKINTKEIQDYRDKYGKEPLWTNSIFGGMPAYLISTRYPGNLMLFADRILRVFQMPVSVLFLSMLGFYILLLMFKTDNLLAIMGAIAYGLSSFFFQILGAGHNTQAIALAYMPPMIGGIYYAYRHNALKGALFTAFILSLEIQANHPQITYYAMMCLLVFIVVEFIFSIKDKTLPGFIKTSGLLILPFIIALGINFASLYSIYEYGKYSIRGESDLITNTNKTTSGLDKDYITTWSYGVDETFNMLIPNYKGGSSQPFDRKSETYKALAKNNAQSNANMIQKYWGTQPGTDGPHYVGAIIIFLFVLGLVLIEGREKWWLLSATILSIMLSWGKNFMPLTDLFINVLPGYNKFRAVTMILVIAEFCIPLLGLLALRDIFAGTIPKERIIKGLKIATGITAGFVLLTIILPGIAGSFLLSYEGAYPDWLKNALISDRKELLRNDSLRSLFFIILSAGLIFSYSYGKIKKEHTIIFLTILIIFDQWTIDKRYLNADKFERPSAIEKSFAPSAADSFILNDHSYFRVMNLTTSLFNDNSPTSYFHKSIGGYHGAKMKRYQELIDSCLTMNLQTIEAIGGKAKTIEDFKEAFLNTNAVNMLNTKYIIYNNNVPPLVNDNALGNAWFAENPVLVSNANKELSLINAFNPSEYAVINETFKNQVTKSNYEVADGDTIKLTSYKPNELIYKYSAKDEKLVVFSEIYYPAGWKCYLDNKEHKYFRADWILRGTVVPAGEHEIRFSFEPSSYYIGNKVSLSSSILLILLIAGYFVVMIRTKSKTV